MMTEGNWFFLELHAINKALTPSHLVHTQTENNTVYFLKCSIHYIIFHLPSKSIRIWKAHRVPLPLIHRCHLLDYEQQLLSIVLSHCHYSLCVGQGQDVKYDLAALEKHIFDRFIQGKPKIQSFMVDVSYTKDAYTAANFTAVRTKCRVQVCSLCLQYNGCSMFYVLLCYILHQHVHRWSCPQRCSRIFCLS